MGYATGQNRKGREIGYAVQATCDEPGCNAKIDRGLAYCCGGIHAVGSSDAAGCGDYFCAEHLFFGGGDGGYMLCARCKATVTCPDCDGEGWDEEEQVECATCDGTGTVSEL